MANAGICWKDAILLQFGAVGFRRIRASRPFTPERWLPLAPGGKNLFSGLSGIYRGYIARMETTI